MKLKVKVNNAPSKGKKTASDGKMTSKMIKVSFENKNAPTRQKMTYTAKVKHPKNSCFQPTIKMVGFPAGKS